MKITINIAYEEAQQNLNAFSAGGTELVYKVLHYRQPLNIGLNISQDVLTGHLVSALQYYLTQILYSFVQKKHTVLRNDIKLWQQKQFNCCKKVCTILNSLVNLSIVPIIQNIRFHDSHTSYNCHHYQLYSQPILTKPLPLLTC